MLRNFLVISFRNLRNNKGASLLNLLCLALGMATCLFIFNYIFFELTYDRFHEKAGTLHRVETQTYKWEEVISEDAFSTYKTGKKLTELLGTIEGSTRLIPFSENGSAFFRKITSENKTKTIYIQQAYYAEPSLFDLFSLEILAGQGAEGLEQPTGLLISESAIPRMFPEAGGDPASVIGRVVHSGANGITAQTHEVTGVFKDLPANSHIHFQTLVAISSNASRLDLGVQENSYTYVLKSRGNKTQEDEILRKYSQAQVKEEGNIYRKQWYFKPIKDIHTATRVSNEPEMAANRLFLTFLFLIGLIILILAGTNYINNAIINSINRAKEVGVRKLAGIKPNQLLVAVMIESFAFNALAAILAIFFFVFGIRAMAVFTDISYPVALSGTVFFRSLLTLIGLILLSGVLAGLYPASLLRSLTPVQALKGKAQVVSSRQSAKGANIMRILLVFQFTMSLIFMSAVYIVQRQLDHMKEHNNQSFELNAVAKFPGLAGANDIFATQAERFVDANMDGTMNRYLHMSNLYNGQIKMMQHIKALYDTEVDSASSGDTFLLQAVDFHYWKDSSKVFLAGQNFNRRFGQDYNGVIIDEAAMRHMKIERPADAIGKKLAKYNGFLNVIGVVKSHPGDEFPKVYVTGLRYPTYFNMTMLAFGSSADKIKAAMRTRELNWSKQFPSFYFITRKYDNQSNIEKDILRMFFFFTFLAVFIACLGVFSLSAFTTLKRTKEIGIRKILGANISQILFVLTYDFMQLLFYGSIVAIPVVFFGMREWLISYSFRISPSPIFVVVPILLMALIAAAIIIKQCWHTTVLNPIQALER